VFAFNNASCVLTVECRNLTLPQAMLGTCSISNPTGDLGEGLIEFPVQSDNQYQFEGRVGPALQSVIVSQNYQVMGSGKVCSE